MFLVQGIKNFCIQVQGRRGQIRSDTFAYIWEGQTIGKLLNAAFQLEMSNLCTSRVISSDVPEVVEQLIIIKPYANWSTITTQPANTYCVRGGSLHSNTISNRCRNFYNPYGILFTNGRKLVCYKGWSYLLYKTRMSESLIFLQFWSDFDRVFARGRPRPTIIVRQHSQGASTL